MLRRSGRYQPRRAYPAASAAPATRSPLDRYEIADQTRPCPLTELPNELLIEIFESAVANGGRCGPLVLTHVCWFWRHIAHSLPRLWTDLRLEFSHGRFPDHIQLAIQWLERAQSHTRSLTIGSRTGSAKSVPRSILRVVPLFADQLRILDFALPFDAFLTMIPLDATFCNLEELRMRPLNFPRGIMSRRRIDGFARAPKLRSLQLVLPSVDWDHAFLSILRVPYAQLTDLSLTLQGSCTPRSTFRYISACTQLLRCTLEIPPFAVVFEGIAPTEYNIPELQSLRIRFVASARYSNLRHDRDEPLIGQTAFLLNSLTMPKLEKFDLELSSSVHRACTWDHAAMLALVRRSMMPLRSLRLARIEVVSAQLVELLHALPSIESLHLHLENTIESNFYEALGYRNRAVSFLPLLKELVVSEDGYSLDRGLDWFIEEAITVRCQWAEPVALGQTPLQKLHITVTRELQSSLKLLLYSMLYKAHKTSQVADVYVADAKEWLGVDRKTNAVVLQLKKKAHE